MTKTPATIAYVTVDKVMQIGTTKTDRPDWSEESQDYHLDRAVRHVMTYKLMRDNNQKTDGENHLELALTRLAMALTMS